jgi:pimeloyl-ACP methyl ester carboxylesterase
MSPSTDAPTKLGSAFSERTVEADGFTIRYFEAGEGEPVAVLHGGGGPSFSVALDLLATNHHVLLFEMPGWGEERNDRTQSFAELARTMAAAFEAVDLETYHLLGTSIGGATAVHLAVQYPDAVRSLILEGPAALRAGAPLRPGADPELLRKAARKHPDRPPAWEGPPLDEARIDVIGPLIQRLMSGPEVDEQLLNDLKDCPVLTLVLFGAEDGIMPPENGRFYRRVMPNCVFTIVYDAAHEIQADRPEAFAEVVDDFLRRGMDFLVNDRDTSLSA